MNNKIVIKGGKAEVGDLYIEYPDIILEYETPNSDIYIIEKVEKLIEARKQCYGLSTS